MPDESPACTTGHHLQPGDRRGVAAFFHLRVHVDASRLPEAAGPPFNFLGNIAESQKNALATWVHFFVDVEDELLDRTTLHGVSEPAPRVTQ